MVPNHEKTKRLSCESVLILIDKWTLILKIVGRKVFLMKPKHQFIYQMRRMCLWCTIMKRKEIIVWIRAYPNWHMNFDSKKLWEEKFFVWNKSINSFVPMRRMSLQHPIINRKKIIMQIYVCPNWQTNISSKMMESEAFSTKPKHQCHLSWWVGQAYGAQAWKEKRLLCESVFVPIDKWTLIVKNGRKWSFSYESKTSISFILMRGKCLWCPNMKRKEIITWICVYSNWQMNFDCKKW